MVATKSIIYADISSTTNTSGVSSAIKTALEAANIKVNAATVAFTTEATISTKAGQAASVSYFNQNGSTGAYTDEMLIISNKATGATGNSTTSVKKTTNSIQKQLYLQRQGKPHLFHISIKMDQQGHIQMRC